MHLTVPINVKMDMDEIIDRLKEDDFVQVVRCKYCKHRKLDEGYYVCELDTGDLYELGRNAEDDNWFCADGERKE